MRVGVVQGDVEGGRERGVALQTQAFVGAGEGLADGHGGGFGGEAAHFGLEVLAGAGDENFGLAGFVLLTGVWGVARLDAYVAAAGGGFGLAAGVGTVRQRCVFALSRAMAGLLAVVEAASQSVAAGLPAGDLGGPAGLVLEDFLAAHAALLHQVWALGTGICVAVALMVDWRMTTCLGSVALVRAGRRLCATRQRWVENCSTTVASDLIKDGFSASATWSTMTEFLAGMLGIPAFQNTSASPCADMLGFEILKGTTRRGFLLPLGG